MAAKEPVAGAPSSTTPFKSPQPQLPSKPPSTTPVKPETASTPRPPPPRPAPDADVVQIPSYSRWFSWDSIHECEVRFLPEFFDSRSPTKNSILYKYYRNSIVKQFRDNPSRKITFTDARRSLVGDVGSIRRVFDFLELWGLINYSSTKPLKWDDPKDAKSAAAESPPPPKQTSRRLCSSCKSVCSIACFYCDKYDLTLCARCYVRGNYAVGVHSTDFRRVEISEETKTDWTDRETLQLLEAIMHYGDDWKKVAQHVSGRSERDCITQFIKLPFGEEFFGRLDSHDAECGSEGNKRIRLTPLADTSNPIMAQLAFLSAVAGVEVAEAAAQAAVAALSEGDTIASKRGRESLFQNISQGADDESNGDTTVNVTERGSTDTQSLLAKQEQDIERRITGITEVQMKEIQEKILRFEEQDLQMEEEWQQVERMKNLLFADQLNLLFSRSAVRKMEERTENL